MPPGTVAGAGESPFRDLRPQSLKSARGAASPPSAFSDPAFSLCHKQSSKKHRHPQWLKMRAARFFFFLFFDDSSLHHTVTANHISWQTSATKFPKRSHCRSAATTRAAEIELDAEMYCVLYILSSPASLTPMQFFLSLLRFNSCNVA